MQLGLEFSHVYDDSGDLARQAYPHLDEDVGHPHKLDKHA